MRLQSYGAVAENSSCARDHSHHTRYVIHTMLARRHRVTTHFLGKLAFKVWILCGRSSQGGIRLSEVRRLTPKEDLPRNFGVHTLDNVHLLDGRPRWLCSYIRRRSRVRGLAEIGGGSPLGFARQREQRLSLVELDFSSLPSHRAR